MEDLGVRLKVIWFPSLNHQAQSLLNRKDSAFTTDVLEILLMKAIMNVVLSLIYCFGLSMTDYLGGASCIRK